ncbi:MAG: ABC transporter permease, partial [Clostridia bacterium]|nr:ABC transporter permease [Clostridia bacterium]
MRSYLDLVSEYAKVHKKKNRLTVICIAVSVMLVTAIFGMADMSLKSQTDEAIRRYGNWHIIVSDISDQTAERIDARADVAVSGFLGMATTAYQGKELVVQSSSEELAAQMNLTVTEGHYPAAETEALLDRPGMEQFGISIGDTVDITFSNGQEKQYQISGTYGDFSSLQGTDAHGLQLAEDGLRFLPESEYREYDYIQFKNRTNIKQAVEELKAEYSLADSQISMNFMLLGLMGQSSDTSMLEVYLTAAILFVLVTMAGTFMIASSFNMSVLERTQFFGLLRCLGATKRQIRKYIRREGLQYCLKAIPAGLLAGTAVLWGAICVLDRLNSQYLPDLPQFQINIPGILAGIVMGVLVVMIASGSPAKNASGVSPQAAVTGNISQTNSRDFKKASNTRLFHVDTAMGLRHAFSNKKSMVLIAGSFALSIILFLCFTILVTFMNHALSPLKPYAPDLTIEGTADTALIPVSLKEEVAALSGSEKVYGRMFSCDIPASDKKGSNMATLVSYDEPQFEWAEDVLISGNIAETQNGDGVLVDYGYSQEFDWKVGDMIALKTGETTRNVVVSGIL